MEVPLLFGPYGAAALEHADRLVQYGANAVWFHGFSEPAFDACAKHELAACVEFKTFRADLYKRPDLVPIGVDGKPIRYGRLVQGVCLAQQEFLQETEENLLAGLRRFQPVGIWLDYLTYAGWFETPQPDLQDSCFCPGCIAEFCEATGVDAATPGEILDRHAALWARHKCERIGGFAAGYAQIIRDQVPGCVVGAYVCPWEPDEYKGALTRIFAQDYALLAPAIDVFTPLIYTTKSGRSATWARTFLERAPGFVPAGRKVQLILDALDFPDSLLATVESPHPSWGIQMFGGAQVFGDPDRAQAFLAAAVRIRKATAAGVT